MDGATPYGTTVSSFSSLSMTPPLVMFALDGRSRTADGSPAQSAVGHQYSRSRSGGVGNDLRPARADRFCDSGVYTSGRGLPRLPGIAAWFECSGEQLITAGDHEIVLATVLSAEIFDGLPLLYAQRTFRNPFQRWLSAACPIKAPVTSKPGGLGGTSS